MHLRSVIGFAAGPVGSALIGLMTVPAIAWLFSPADVGRLNIFHVSMSFALLLSMMGLDQAFVREFHESDARGRLLRSCFIPGFVVILLVSVVALANSSEVASALFGAGDAALVWLTVIAILVGYVSRFLSLILRMQERGWAYSGSQAVPKLLTLALVLCVPMFNWAAEFRTLLAITIVGLLSVMLVFAWNTRSEWLIAWNQRSSRQEVVALLSYGLPLAFSGLAYWGLTATSTFALRRWSTLEELAIYSVTNSFAGAAVIFQSVFGTIWAPTVYKWVALGVDMRRVDSVSRYVLVAAVLVVVVIGALSWTTLYFLPNHYLPVQYLLACAILPSMLYTMSEVTSVGITISRRTRWAVIIASCSLCINILLSRWLVPAHGAVGAVLSNGVAFFVFFALRTEVSAALWRQFPRAKMYFIVAVLLMVASLVAALNVSLPVGFPFIWVVVLVFASLIMHREVRELTSLAWHRISNLRS